MGILTSSLPRVYQLSELFTFSTAFTYGFEKSAYSVLESDGQVHFCVTADRGDGSEVYLVSINSLDITTQGRVHMAVV